MVYSLGWEMSTHSSSLAWKIPWTEEPGGLQSMGPQNVSPDWATEHMVLLRKPEFTFIFLSPEFRDFYKKLLLGWNQIVFLQFSSVAQSCPTLCDPMNRRTPRLPVQHHCRSLPNYRVSSVLWKYHCNPQGSRWASALLSFLSLSVDAPSKYHPARTQ